MRCRWRSSRPFSHAVQQVQQVPTLLINPITLPTELHRVQRLAQPRGVRVEGAPSAAKLQVLLTAASLHRHLLWLCCCCAVEEVLVVVSDEEVEPEVRCGRGLRLPPAVHERCQEV